MALVSVIVPAYNSAKTLPKCLAGLVNQTLEDIEIILVNDCSADNTYQIMTEYESQFPEKIIVVNLSENLGAGGARNVGLTYASGDYIGFVDSDDEIVPTMYEKLYSEAVNHDYDIVDCGYFDESKDNAMVHTSDELTGTLDDHKRSELIVSGGYLWSRIFRRSLFNECNITFRAHCILEDCETLMLLTAKARSVGNVKEILYCYRSSPGSLSMSTDINSYYRNVTAATEAVYNTISTLPGYGGIKEAVEYVIVNFCLMIIKNFKDNMNLPAAIRAARVSKAAKYLNSMVTIPLENNHYVKNKVPKEDIRELVNIAASYAHVK